MTRSRYVYELVLKDVVGFPGDVVVDRWSVSGNGDVRLLVVDRFGGREHRANVVVSRREARRLARALVRLSE